MNLENKVVVITGAASGIGETLCRLIHQERAIVIGVDQHPCSEKNVAWSIICDLSSQTENQRVFDTILQKYGKIDVFIANAGFAYHEQQIPADWEHIARVFQVNSIAPIWQYARFRLENPNGFFVLNISAMAYLAMPGYALYAATKSALLAFISADDFYKPRSHHVMTVYPVSTHTSFFQDHHRKPWPVQSPQIVAKAILKGIKKRKRTVYPSILFRIFYFVFSVFPFVGKLYQRFWK